MGSRLGSRDQYVLLISRLTTSTIHNNKQKHRLTPANLLSFLLPQIDAIDVMENEEKVSGISAQRVREEGQLIVRSFECPCPGVEEFV